MAYRAGRNESPIKLQLVLLLLPVRPTSTSLAEKRNVEVKAEGPTATTVGEEEEAVADEEDVKEVDGGWHGC